jgi:hypothetical protein
MLRWIDPFDIHININFKVASVIFYWILVIMKEVSIAY